MSKKSPKYVKICQNRCLNLVDVLIEFLTQRPSRLRQPGSLLIAALGLGQMVTVVQQLTATWVPSKPWVILPCWKMLKHELNHNHVLRIIETCINITIRVLKMIETCIEACWFVKDVSIWFVFSTLQLPNLDCFSDEATLPRKSLAFPVVCFEVFQAALRWQM